MPYYGYYGGYGDFFANNIYCMLLIPVLLLSLWAQVAGAAATSGGTAVLPTGGVSPAPRRRRRCCGPTASTTWPSGPAPGDLTDHYDPRDNTIYLSENVYDAPTIAAVGVAAHEAGHAVQYAENYGPVRLRTAIIPATQIGSKLFFHPAAGGHGPVQPVSVFRGYPAVFPDHDFPAGHPAGGVQRLPPGHCRRMENEAACCMTMSFPAHGKVLRAAALTYVAALLMILPCSCCGMC